MKELLAQIKNPLPNAQNIPQFIQGILDQALPFVLGIAVVFIMYGGFLIAKAGGNEAEYKKGKEAVMWAIIGLFIVVAAKAIIDGVLTTLGLQ